MINVWKIVESHCLNHALASPQIESYNHFITNDIPDIIKKQYINIPLNKLQSFVIYFQNVYMDKPFIYDSKRNKQVLYPSEARKRDLSYETVVTCDIELILLDKNTQTIVNSQTFNKVELFKLPVMLNSCLCNLKTTSDLMDEEEYNGGGYFVIKGKERVIIAQERINYNQVYVYARKNKYKYVAEIRSIKESADYSVLLQAKIRNDDKLIFTIPYITQDIPIAILFIAMGVDIDFLFENIDKDSPFYIAFHKAVEPHRYMEQKECINYISEFTINKVDEMRKIKYVTNIIQNEILPHLGACTDPKFKALLLVKLLEKLLATANGERIENNRDHICNKRIEMVGDLLGNLINSLFKRSIKSMQQFIEKRDDICKLADLNIVNVMGRCNITQRLYYCFNTGNWGLPKSNYIRQGVSQILSRLSYIATMSHLRRIVIPIGKESRNTEVRQIHPTYYGFVDPVETPEGQPVGIVGNFAIPIRVSGNTDTVYITDIIDQHFLDIQRCFEILDKCCIFVNGIWIGSISNDIYPQFISHFKELRRMFIVPPDVSIGFDDKDNEINIKSDTGRMLRPVIDVEKIDQLQHTIETTDVAELWNVLLDKNIVLYIDGNEAESSVIAMWPEDLVDTTIKYAYCEIHPSLILGICSSTIPYPCHSQCIFKDEPVFMEDGTCKKICEVNIGDNVITFNPETQEQSISEVSHIYTNTTDKKMYQLTTFSGRKISATFDHRFMTKKGWTRLEHISPLDINSPLDSSLVAILLEQTPVSTNVDEYIVLNDVIFRQKCVEKNISNVDKYISELQHLFPLKSTSPLLPIISRLFGFCLTDTWVGVSKKGIPRISVNIGCEYGMKLFIQDICRLGFADKSYRYSERPFGNVYITEYCGSLPALMVALGCIFGKKTTQPYISVPSWIMNGSKMVKREFLAGFQGGDGSKIKSSSQKQLNIHIGHTSKFIETQYMDSLYDFMKQLIDLFCELNIEISGPSIKKSNHHENRMIVSYAISSKRKNLIAYYDYIGYRYDVFKIIDSGKLIEFSKYLERILNERIDLVNTVKVLHQTMRPLQIAVKLDLPVKKIYKILKLTGKKIGLPSDYLSLDKWLTIVKSSSTTIFVPIVSKTEIESTIISDITIKSTNQSFICGDNYCVHNSPRNVYVSAMMKQAVGMYALSHNTRWDTMGHVMDYPQKKLVTTKIAQYYHCEDMPSGQEAIVAIMCYGGNNQEDSILLKKGSIERGMFNSISYRVTSINENKKGTHDSEVIQLPPSHLRNKNYNYSKLDENGIVLKNTKVEKNDVLIGKVYFNNDEPISDCSLVCKASEEGIVHNIEITTNASGYKHIKVKIRQIQFPEIGDKFCQVSAQKGVCGTIYSDEDMPFTGNGISPDIIINPHAIPSRMTINMLMEMLSSKVGCFSGEIQDATAFDHDGEQLVEEMGEELVKMGYDRMGNEIMYNGFTGMPFKVKIFIGPAYYQRLKHLVSQKIHSRSVGNVQVLSRQPCAGRAREGGLRFGEINFWSQWYVKILLVIMVWRHFQIAGTSCQVLITNSV